MAPDDAGPGLVGEGASPSEITTLLVAIERGETGAVDRLFEQVYGELRRLARRQLGHGPASPTLDTTALVHEAYLRLSGEARWSVESRRHFFNLAARAMRNVLVDHARRRGRVKRGGDALRVDLDAHEIAAPDRATELVALDDALVRLAASDAELARLVELRFFAGLSIEEIAELFGVSDRTIKRRWRAARALLYRDLATLGFGS